LPFVRDRGRETVVGCDSRRSRVFRFQEVAAGQLSSAGATSGSSASPASALCMWSAVLDELQGAGVWPSVTEADAGARSLRLSVSDPAGRQHHLRAVLPLDSPRSPPQTACELPQALPQYSTLGRTFAAFASAVQRYQALWDELDDIDARAACVGYSRDSRPPRSSATRRLAVDRDVTVQVSLDLERPHDSMPDVWVLGPDSRSAALSQRVTRGRHSWDSSRHVLDNLREALGVEFQAPQGPESTDADAAGPAPCGICLAHDLEGQPPSRFCEKCGQAFHAVCLYEWLRSAAGGSGAASAGAAAAVDSSFGVIFGKCPYCENRLSARVP
jgi:E3 ubiquitin-protein ligase FANCL